MKRYPDLMISSVQANPYSLYEELRSHDPIYKMPGTGFILVTSFELCRQIIMQPDKFASGVSPMVINPEGVPDEIAQIYERYGWLPKASCSTSDPPRHTWVRSLLSKLFTGRKVREITPYIKSAAHELLGDMMNEGSCEFVQSFAQPLPMLVIAKLIGVSADDLTKFKQWSDAIVDLFSMMVTRDRQVECARLIVEMQHYFNRQIEFRRVNPQDDYLTILSNSTDDNGENIPIEELLSIITIDLLASGNETTTAAIASGVLMLAKNQDIQHELRNDKSLIPVFVEEVLRLESPAQGMFRRVTSDTVLGDYQFQTDDILSLRFGAANRDGATFLQADEVDLTRHKPGNHLAFGVGRHSCIGAPLARQELITSFEIIVDHLAKIRLLEPNWIPEYVPSFFGRNLIELPIAYKQITI